MGHVSTFDILKKGARSNANMGLFYRNFLFVLATNASQFSAISTD